MIILHDRASILIITIQIMLLIFPLTMSWALGEKQNNEGDDLIPLPSASFKGIISVEEAIVNRRTERSFSSEPLALKEWGQILWAAQGITSSEGIKKRSAPSAGALYPLDIYLILGENALKPTGSGVFHYLPIQHALRRLSKKDLRKKVAEASLYQLWMAEAPGMIVITAEYPRITGKYGNRGIRYAHIEAGHVAQNCFLQAESLQLCAGIVGAFDDEALSDLLPFPEGHDPILILPVGRQSEK